MNKNTLERLEINYRLGRSATSLRSRLHCVEGILEDLEDLYKESTEEIRFHIHQARELVNISWQETYDAIQIIQAARCRYSMETVRKVRNILKGSLD